MKAFEKLEWYHSDSIWHVISRVSLYCIDDNNTRNLAKKNMIDNFTHADLKSKDVNTKKTLGLVRKPFHMQWKQVTRGLWRAFILFICLNICTYPQSPIAPIIFYLFSLFQPLPTNYCISHSLPFYKLKIYVWSDVSI